MPFSRYDLALLVVCFFLLFIYTLLLVNLKQRYSVHFSTVVLKLIELFFRHKFHVCHHLFQQFFVLRCHSFTTSAKKGTKIGTPPPLFTTIQFWPSLLLLLLDVLTWPRLFLYLFQKSCLKSSELYEIQPSQCFSEVLLRDI